LKISSDREYGDMTRNHGRETSNCSVPISRHNNLSINIFKIVWADVGAVSTVRFPLASSQRLGNGDDHQLLLLLHME
jgi:hypothetical protein